MFIWESLRWKRKGYLGITTCILAKGIMSLTRIPLRGKKLRAYRESCWAVFSCSFPGQLHTKRIDRLDKRFWWFRWWNGRATYLLRRKRAATTSNLSIIFLERFGFTIRSDWDVVFLTDRTVSNLIANVIFLVCWKGEINKRIRSKIRVHYIFKSQF